MKKQRWIAVVLALLLSACPLAACDGGDSTDREDTSESPTAQVTAPMTEIDVTEAQTEPATNPPATQGSSTEDETSEPETERPTRDDWEKNDPDNPYYNLIQVGTSYDGKTPCYDGRYDFGYTICHTEDGKEFSSVQDAIDWIDGLGGRIYMDAAPNVCLKVDIPQDGAFYRIAYWWLNCDFVMDYGVIYDDQQEKDGIVGYAYYSDLYHLDCISGLENTYVWIIKETEGLAPGYYKMLPADASDERYYKYDMVAPLDAWPGLPDGEMLPE